MDHKRTNIYVDYPEYNITVIHVVAGKNQGTIWIDLEDKEIAKQYHWHLQQTSEFDKCIYAVSFNNSKRKKIRLHRLIMQIEDPNIFIDHINRNTLDNTKKNLRVANRSINARNRNFLRTNTSGRTGVRYDEKRNRYTAQIEIINPKKKMLKAFSIAKFGKEKAYQMACEQREKWENEFKIETAKIKES